MNCCRSSCLGSLGGGISTETSQPGTLELNESEASVQETNWLEEV